MRRPDWLFGLFFSSLLRRSATQLLDGEACLTSFSLVSTCLSQSPALSTITAFAASATCLCYSGDTWAPYLYDNYHQSCFSFYTARNTIDAVTANIPTAPCQFLGNFRGATATAVVSTLPNPATTDPRYRACTSADMALSSCTSLSPGLFTADPATAPNAPASCLCYSGSVWMPLAYDKLLESCYAYFATAYPALYAAATSKGVVTSPCISAGDVRATSSSTASATNVRVASSTESIKNSGGLRRIEVKIIGFNLLSWVMMITCVTI